jgi:hypothetical protein
MPEEIHGGPLDWISRTLHAFDAVSGYTFAALAVAGVLILRLPSLLGIDLTPVRQSWGGWIVVATVAFSLLAGARILRVGHHFVTPILGQPGSGDRKRQVRELKSCAIWIRSQKRRNSF